MAIGTISIDTIDASRGPSAIAELLVKVVVTVTTTFSK